MTKKPSHAHKTGSWYLLGFFFFQNFLREPSPFLNGVPRSLLGDISYHKATLQSEGKHSIHSIHIPPGQIGTFETRDKLSNKLAAIHPSPVILKFTKWLPNVCDKNLISSN